RLANRPQGRKLRLEVEAVTRLGLERRGARAQHPLPVTRDALAELVRGGSTRSTDGGHDPAAAGVQLLVRRAAGAQRELLHAIAGEARVRVAVDEPRDRAQSTAVEH